MKAKITYALSLAMALLLTLGGCKDEFDPDGIWQPSLFPHFIDAGNQSFEFTSKGGEEVVNFAYGGQWSVTVEPSSDWLDVVPASGNGSAEIVVRAADNASAEDRSAEIVITADSGQSVRIPLTQKCRYLRVSASAVLIREAGGASDPITIETDGSYDISADADWFKINRTGDSFTVSASENTSKDIRRGKIRVWLTDLKSGSLEVVISIVQASEGGSFVIDSYPVEDSDWNNGESGDGATGAINVVAEGYAPDVSWDSLDGESVTVEITGFSGELNWN